PTPRAVLRVAAPRMLRDTLGPLAAFYVLWKTVGLAAGVLGALAVGLVALYFARREGRPGAFVRVVLAIVLFRAAVGLIGHSTTIYLAQDAVIDVALGSAFLGDRKSTRLNSSHVEISYAVFCLKKKKNNDKLNPDK